MPERARNRHRTADGFKVSIGDVLWSIDDFSNGQVVKSLSSDWAQSGKIVLVGGEEVHLSLYFYVKKSAMFYQRNIISEKLLQNERDQGFLASDLKTLDESIRNL